MIEIMGGACCFLAFIVIAIAAVLVGAVAGFGLIND